MEIRVSTVADIKKKINLFFQLHSIQADSAQINVFFSGESNGEYRHFNLLSPDFKSLMKPHQTDEVLRPIGKIEHGVIQISVNYAKFTLV